MSAEQDLANANVQIANLISEVTRFRDAAMGLNNIYPTITEGRQAVSDGKYFSVPGGGAYMRLYRRQGSSAQLIAEFPDRAQVQALVNTLGGRGVVGGSGDLMAEGAYGLGTNGGLGTNLPNNDLDSVSDRTILFRYDANTLNRPPSLGAGTGIAAIWAGGEQTQTLVDHFPDSVRGQQWTRAYRAGSWGPMRKQYDSRNILDSVSQSGGVPTGGVIERGSNGFGRWTKFANGLRIQHTVRLSVVLSGSLGINVEYTIPQAVSTDATAYLTAEFLSPGVDRFAQHATKLIRNILTIRFAANPSTNADFGFYATIIDYWY
ncbi:hypothetical protein ACQKD0_05175 [Vreelandella aquamarina]|uniref:hypothetical protein n=1 Tax=Vreelandella aquamarina TaxID=77097 RepID=UPI003CFF87E3